MKCINCDNEAVGKSMYCGDSCKTVFNRNRRNTKTVTKIAVTPESVTNVTETKSVTQTVTEENCEVNETCPVCPHKEDCHALAEVDKIELVITQHDFNDLIQQLPEGVSRPLGLPNTDTAKLSAHDLSYAVRRCPGVSWIESAAYAETIYRLLTQDEPNVCMIPAWKAAC